MFTLPRIHPGSQSRVSLNLYHERFASLRTKLNNNNKHLCACLYVYMSVYMYTPVDHEPYIYLYLYYNVKIGRSCFKQCKLMFELHIHKINHIKNRIITLSFKLIVEILVGNI